MIRRDKYLIMIILLPNARSIVAACTCRTAAMQHKLFRSCEDCVRPSTNDAGIERHPKQVAASDDVQNRLKNQS